MLNHGGEEQYRYGKYERYVKPLLEIPDQALVIVPAMAGMPVVAVVPVHRCGFGRIMMFVRVVCRLVMMFRGMVVR